MSSFLRRLQRARLRSSKDYEPAPQPTIVRSDGSYLTLHPTKGWLYMSARRIRAQFRMAAHHERGEMTRLQMAGRRKKPARVWRIPAPVPPSSVTRQQTRAALR